MVHQLGEYLTAEIHPPFCVAAAPGHSDRFSLEKLKSDKSEIARKPLILSGFLPFKKV